MVAVVVVWLLMLTQCVYSLVYAPGFSVLRFVSKLEALVACLLN